MTALLRLRRPLAVVLAALALFAAACVPEPPPPPELVNHRDVMGNSSLTWEQLGWFFAANDPPGEPLIPVTIGELTSYFVWEGAREGVRGDLAFAQAIVETGWFRYGGQVDWTQNNFAGIGATDGGAAGASFPDAVTGVRAQIQHLRAYADRTATKCTEPPLHAPCVDPRFDLVSPKGKASSWEQMGNGNWATDPTYSEKVIEVYNKIRVFMGLPTI